MSLVEGEVVVRAEARVGTVLRGKYRLDRVLGVGGMAAVYAATHRNSKRFAVKVLHPELSLQSDVRARFLREGYAATQVNHPGAVTVLDDDVAEDGAAFLVMELLDGTTIDALWEQHRYRLPLGAALALGHQLLDVLAAAHGNGIVHRDIKPENLFLTTEAQLKILDFGIARLKDVANNSLTGAGLVIGTPAFMAPEQALGKSSQIDAQSDIWSAGAVLFTLLSGKFVHEGESPQEIVVQCATEPARSLATVWPEAPKEVVQLVDSALAYKKTSRWSTAVAMQKGIEAAARAVLGAAPSRAALLKLITDPPDPGPSVPAVHDSLAPTPVRDLAAPAAGERTEGAEAAASTAAQVPSSPASAPRRIGLTTDRPVLYDSAVTPSWILRHKALWAGAVGAVTLGILAIVLSHGQGQEDAAQTRATAASAAAPPEHATNSALAAPAPPPEPPPVESSPPVEAQPSAAPPVASHAASAPPAPYPPGRPAAAPRPAPPAVPAAEAQPNCTPPFTLDPVTGKKKWKAECL